MNSSCNNNNNEIYNDKLFFLIFRNKILKNKILFHLKLINLYKEQREVIIDEHKFKNSVEYYNAELNKWDHPHKEYYKSIRISYISNSSVEKAIRFIGSLPSNIKDVELSKIRDLTNQNFKLLMNVCDGLIKRIKLPYLDYCDESFAPNSLQHVISSHTLKSLNGALSRLSIFQNGSKLTVLDLRPSNYSIQFQLNELPPTLTTLYLHHKFDSKIIPGSFPQSLKKLKFGLNFNQVIDDPLMLPLNLESIEFSINYEQKLDFKYFPKSIQKIKILTMSYYAKKFKNQQLLPNLKLFSIRDSFYPSFKLAVSLEKLSMGISDPKTLKSLSSLKFLKKLYLENTAAKVFFCRQNKQEFKKLSALKYLPSSLESLKLKSFTELSFTIDLLPKSIKKIKIQYNNLYEKAINEIKLPPSVHTLKLMISQVITPTLLVQNHDQLKRLKFSNGFEFSIQKDSLPKSLLSVEFGSSYKFRELFLPAGLKYLKLSAQFDFPLTKEHLPPNLKVLEIGKKFKSYELTLDQLPKSLCILIIRGETKLKLTSPSSSSQPLSTNLNSIYLDSLNHSILSNLNLTLQLIDKLKPISTLKLKKLYNKIIKNNLFNNN